jgi:multiple sugar transport system permease protein
MAASARATQASTTRWVLLAPVLIVIFGFTLAPLANLVWLGFNRVEWIGGLPRFDWVGLVNYRSVAADGLYRAALWNTAVFAVAAVTLQIIIGLALALLVSGAGRGQIVYRALLLLPVLIPGIVIGAIWKLMLNYDFGLVNAATGALGLLPQDWLGNPRTALAAVVVVDIWHWVPFCFLLLLAGLQSIPDDVIEAAKLDGANAWRRLWFVILPLMLPTLTVTFVFRLISAFKVFDEVFLLTSGGPGTATEVLSFTIYRRFFIEDQAGYGAALSVTTIAFIGVIIVVLDRLVRRRATAEA